MTDLTNTTWLLNNTFTTAPSGRTFSDLDDSDEDYMLNFSSNNTNYTILTFRGTGYTGTGINYYYNGAPISERYVWDYSSRTWRNQAYRTINITSGSGATNTTLINWLLNNATQQVEPEPTQPTTNKIGNLEIIKKHFGDLEIIKEVLNGSTIYESVKTYTITSTITNGSYTGDSTITNTASVTISANSGYSLPSTISVSGATYTYDSSTGVVSLSNPTGNVTIEATCVASYPVKSDIITMNLDGTNKQYRVLKQVSGSVFDVMSMFGVEHAYGSQYSYDAPSSLKTYLENDYYNTFTTEAKNAIVEAQQYRPAEVQIRNISTMGSDTTKYYNQSPTNASQIEEITLSSEIKINYKIRPITIRDIVEYIDKWKFNFNDIRTMFANNTTTFTYCALPNHKYGQSSYIFGMSNGSLNNTYQVSSSTSRTFRIKLQIDLSKISFTIEA